MSRLIETQRAYRTLNKLLDQEIRKKGSSMQELERFRKTLDIAFYLLGWAQFEHQVRKQIQVVISEKARTRSVDRHAWSYLKQNVRSIPLRSQLDIVFHSNQAAQASLKKDYECRNELAHNNADLPPDAADLAMWFSHLQGLVDRF